MKRTTCRLGCGSRGAGPGIGKQPRHPPRVPPVEDADITALLAEEN